MILGANISVIALAVFLGFHYNFDKSVGHGGYYAQEPLPYDFHEQLMKETFGRPDSVPPRRRSDYDSIKKALWITIPGDNEIIKTQPPTDVFNEDKFNKFVTSIDGVVFNYNNPNSSGTWLKMAGGDTSYFQTGDAVVYGDKYPVKEFWLDSIEKSGTNEIFILIFRDKNGNKSKPKKYDYKSDNLLSSL